MNRSVLLVAALGIGLAGLTVALAQQSRAELALPFAKPENPDAMAFPNPGHTAAIPRTGRLPAAATELKLGLDAISNRDGAAALAIRDRMADGLDRHILTWSIAMSGLSSIPSDEIAAAQRQLQTWPGTKAFRANYERALARENPPARDLIKALGADTPETPQGAMALAKALVSQGDAEGARKVLNAFWRNEPLDKSIEDKMLADFGSLLTAADHKARMDYLLYRGRVEQAKRFSSLGEAQSLFNAWSAVIKRSSTADTQIRKVDARWSKDPALLYLRIEQLRRQEKYAEAAKLLAQVPRETGKLVNATEWWNEQRIVARGLADRGDFRAAYGIVSRHVAEDPTDIVDAEFHAGWYALRALKDPKTASVHFNRILATSQRPLSVSRAYYWLGRAAEDAKSPDARSYFAKAAAHPSTFYGQLASARLNQPPREIAYPSPTAEDRRRFATREAVQAIARYEASGHGWRAAALFRALAQDLDSPGELALLAARAERAGDHQLSLQIGKTAYGRGVDVPALAFPIGVIPASADIAGSGKALAYAIARQESSFNPAAVSPANAKGLLQILPTTAKGVAGRHGLAFYPEKLTTDAGYNATLGAHYLGEQIDSFGGSYIMTFIAYNAGPKRVPEWIARYGNPQGKPIDEVVDWIERIPFPETRNYVQRVMENYQIYKARLGGKPDIEHDLRFGR